MFSPPKFLTTLFLGAVSGLGFYSMSSPATRLSAVATHYLFPSSSGKSESTVHKTDRGALRDPVEGFEDRWHLSQFSGWSENMWWQITASNELC